MVKAGIQRPGSGFPPAREGLHDLRERNTLGTRRELSQLAR